MKLILIIILLVTSCSHWDQCLVSERYPASKTEKIIYYLNIDKFKYYLNEYSLAFEGKISDEIIESIRKISIKEILAMNIEPLILEDANNYDEIIYSYLKNKNLIGKLKKADLKWNYNFFRNKLNEAFTLTTSKLNIDLGLSENNSPSDRELPLEKALYQSDEMTLDSGHYISNRTTRAIFWEAIENDRTIEFHLGDSREFLKNLKTQGGEILYEVRPLAKNYNKIYIVKYPGEVNYRYAITNIGGNDRLNHLTNQLSLSNLSGGALKNKVVIKGSLENFHQSRTEEHILQLKHLPQADRVIIGQKESIDGKFNLFWKINALKTLYDDDPELFKKVDPALLLKFQTLSTSEFEIIFKDKKIVEDLFAHFEAYFEDNQNKMPPKYKIFNYDNFTIEMCDYVFKNSQGKIIRWRVVSNVWGDEIIPIAKAFKATGHTNIVYMGTAGAFANKGYKVGDLVIPSAVVDTNKKLPIKSNPMKIDIAKYGGSVEHVGSPFEETQKWLDISKVRSEFVEVETSYLQKIFNGPQDNLEIYLLISDILGSDTETLAHATSSKRKNAQNRLLAELFKRDSLVQIPKSIELKITSKEEALRELVNKVLPNKGLAYRYMIFSKLKDKSKVTESMIIKLAENEPAFSDSFLINELFRVGEAITQVKKIHNTDFDIVFNESIATGTFNPKTDKIKIMIIPKNEKEKLAYSKTLRSVLDQINGASNFVEVNVDYHLSDFNFVQSSLPKNFDQDVLLNIYTYSSFSSHGLYDSITYNGNVTFNSMPTNKLEPAHNVFNFLGYKYNFTNCSQEMNNFLKIIQQN